MENLLKAIRNELIGDATLIALVPAADITSSYLAESANYPCVILSIRSGGSVYEISGVTKARLHIGVYSRTSKINAWDIYSQVKSLLHNQERNITDATTLVHICLEQRVDDKQYDIISNAWLVEAEYEIIFSTSSVVATSAIDGALYADTSDVSVDASKEVAKFRGTVGLNLSFSTTPRSERERFNKNVHFSGGIAEIVVGEMIFKPSITNTIWSIETDASNTLADDSTSATVYTVQQSSYPKTLQVLFHFTKTDDGKIMEIEARKAYCTVMSVPFRKTDLTVFNCRWICLGDDSDNVVRVAVEN